MSTTARHSCGLAHTISLTLITALVALSAGCATARCNSVRGVEALFAPGRMVLVGEHHGTREMPATFVAIVKQALERGFDVVVGFELPPAMGDEIDRYLSSDGSLAARLDIVEPRRKYGDGSSSRAMTDAFESLRRLHATHENLRVFGFRAERTEISYANGIERAHRASPNALLIAFMGGGHAQLVMESDDTEPTAAMLLKSRGLDLVAVNLDCEGGAAHFLGPNGSRTYALDSVGSLGSVCVVQKSRTPMFDAFISVGTAHASLPQRTGP